MDVAFNILVIILSTALFIFLVIAIVAIIFVVKLVGQLRNIAEKGSHIADKAGELTDTIVDSAKTHSFIKTVGGLVSAVKKFK
jgi:predicted PurR-regulated permease PerM